MWDVIKVYGPFALLVIAGFAVAAHFVQPAPPSKIRMATGSPGGVYASMGEKYRKALAVDGIDVELVETTGSMSNLVLLTTEDDGVDVAFMQGGIGSQVEAPDLVSLGSVYPEALWVLGRTDRRPISSRDLKGYRLAIGAEGSGSSILANDLLTTMGMDEDAVVRVFLGGKEAAEALLQGEVDGVVYVSGGESTTIRALMVAPGIELRPFHRAETYARLYNYLSVVTLPEGIVDLKTNIPPETVTMLATTASLVARDDLHPAIQSLLLRAARDIHDPGGLFAEPGEFPSPHFTDFPLSDEAERFYEKGPSFLNRYLPFWAANLVQRLIVLAIPLVTLLLPFFKFAPPLYQWRIRRRIYKWYENVRGIEYRARAATSGDGRASAVADLDVLQSEVGNVKVPLSYADQLFALRLHIQFVRNLIESGELTGGSQPTESAKSIGR